ncbi:MarR family winged helix-turn-helix transcriptional regulator [Amorphus orientalis]|uniref:DNA-binding MarR family transcriptional regulator n=1 Tax=Amorphus orientalis TaxID=649198 RepID=A0AAE3VMG3_9HYPH|nr:MarR family winged helix-turn-helix transcriptional regulator [Amorphus orientalis]MDQ0314768.1 DNA-binding MarR family transcriptional regulator [Amorphus orientalis]
MDMNDRPGHLARRFQQIAVAIFHAEAAAVGCDLTPVQYAALATVAAHDGIDQVTLAGSIAYDRTTITGVVDRLAHKGLLERRANARDRRARALHVTDLGREVLVRIEPAVDAAQRTMLRGLSEDEAEVFLTLFRKAIDSVNDLSRAPMRGAPSSDLRAD